jgi:hypothetical protein
VSAFCVLCFAGRLDPSIAPLPLTVHGMLLQGAPRLGSCMPPRACCCSCYAHCFLLLAVCCCVLLLLVLLLVRLLLLADWLTRFVLRRVALRCFCLLFCAFIFSGCNFDGHKLSESLLDSAANSALGDCHFAWVPGDAPSPYPVSANLSTHYCQSELQIRYMFAKPSSRFAALHWQSELQSCVWPRSVTVASLICPAAPLIRVVRSFARSLVRLKQDGESVKVPLYSSGARSDAIADVLLPSARHDVSQQPVASAPSLSWLALLHSTSVHPRATSGSLLPPARFALLLEAAQVAWIIEAGSCHHPPTTNVRRRAARRGPQVNRWVLAGVALFVFAED